MRIRVPSKGINRFWSFESQARDTTPDAQNFRLIDPGSGRARGGQRPGHTRYINAQPTGSADTIQAIDSFAVDAAYSGATTLGVRTVKGFTVANGNAYTFTTSFASPTNSASAFSATAPVIYTTRFFDDIYVADGATGYKYYDTSADNIATLSASAGSLPANGANKARLIGTYFNRLILAGINGEPHNIYASKVDDSTDWDFTVNDSTAAWAGNDGSAFKLPQKITAICDLSENDMLIVGCDSAIYAMVGDPAFGGQLVHFSSVTGMAWGEPFCINPDHQIYFFGSRGGIFRIDPNDQMTRITRGVIDEDLATVDLSSTLVRMAWDDRQQGFHLYLTDLGGGASTHWWYDYRSESFWKDKFDDNNQNPVAVHVFDGDDSDDRVVLLGGQDGYIRQEDVSATNDDATAIDSYVYFPVLQADDGELQLQEVSAILASGSSDATLDVYAGDNAEEAFDSTYIRFTGTFSAGANHKRRPRIRGDAIFLKLSNSTLSETWAFEEMNVKTRNLRGVSTGVIR